MFATRIQRAFGKAMDPRLAVMRRNNFVGLLVAYGGCNGQECKVDEQGARRSKNGGRTMDNGRRLPAGSGGLDEMGGANGTKGGGGDCAGK